jgi:integrase
MAKGISAAKALQNQLKKLEQDTLVQRGAKKYPGSEVALPRGIAIRSEKGVQIEFMYKGERCYETILGRPTIRHVREAAEKRERILQLIGLNKFEFASEFPDSPRIRSPQIDSQSAVIARPKTIGMALDEWLITVKPSVGHNAGEDYSKDIKRLKGFIASRLLHSDESPAFEHAALLGDVPVIELHDTSITNLQTWLLRQPGSKPATTLSIKRVRNLMIPLRGAMDRLATKGTISTNPFSTVRALKQSRADYPSSLLNVLADLDASLPLLDGKPIKETEEVVEPFTPDEVSAILAQVSGSFKNQLQFWFWTGLRTGELIALRWADFDRTGNRIYIRRSLSRGHLKLPKFDKCRWVNLNPAARAALDEQFQLTGDSAAWVFPNPHTMEMWANESKIQTRFKAATDRAGVRYRRPYNCRHTFASVMLSSGENILYVADQMGHEDWHMLVKVYGRWIADVDAKAGERVAAVESNRQHSLSVSPNFRAAVAPLGRPNPGDARDVILDKGAARVGATLDATSMRQPSSPARKPHEY